MTHTDFILDLSILLAFGISALFTLVRSALASADIPDLDGGPDTTAHDMMVDVRQDKTQASYALFVLEQLSMIAAVFLLSTALWSWFESVAFESYGYLLVASSAIILRVILSSLAERYAEKLVPLSLVILRLSLVITYPLTVLLEKISTLISGQQSEEEAREEMEDEITAIMDEAVQDGTLDADEYRILTNIMQFSEVTVRDVMTPRNVVFSMPAGSTIQEVVDRIELQTYSRFPVCQEQSLDEVLGYCLTRDVFSSALRGRSDQSLDTIMRDVHFIPENVRLDKALEEFLTRRQHMFIVVDEYGGVEGLLTMEDVVETILGAEIVDEADRVVDLRQLASQRRDTRVAAIQQGSQGS